MRRPKPLEEILESNGAINFKHQDISYLGRINIEKDSGYIFRFDLDETSHQKCEEIGKLIAPEIAGVFQSGKKVVLLDCWYQGIEGFFRPESEKHLQSKQSTILVFVNALAIEDGKDEIDRISVRTPVLQKWTNDDRPSLCKNSFFLPPIKTYGSQTPTKITLTDEQQWDPFPDENGSFRVFCTAVCHIKYSDDKLYEIARKLLEIEIFFETLLGEYIAPQGMLSTISRNGDRYLIFRNPAGRLPYFADHTLPFSTRSAISHDWQALLRKVLNSKEFIPVWERVALAKTRHRHWSINAFHACVALDLLINRCDYSGNIDPSLENDKNLILEEIAHLNLTDRNKWKARISDMAPHKSFKARLEQALKCYMGNRLPEKLAKDIVKCRNNLVHHNTIESTEYASEYTTLAKLIRSLNDALLLEFVGLSRDKCVMLFRRSLAFQSSLNEYEHANQKQ